MINMNQYRIVTNNNTFRIEKLRLKGIFKKLEVWSPIGRYNFLSDIFKIKEFSSYDDAKICMDNIIEQEEIEARPWKVVNENPIQ